MHINCVLSKFLTILAVNYPDMSTFRISERGVRSGAIASTVVFACLAALYFIPADIPHKIAFPLAALTAASLWLCPWQITVALAASAAGDLAGSYSSLIVQMGMFAIAHALFIWYFIKRYREKVRRTGKPTEKTTGYIFLIICMCLVAAAFSYAKIVSNTPAGILRTGCGIYVALICIMLCLAFLQRSSLYALGALLFVFSDFILGWNLFTAPIKNAGWLIMVPYYLGQWLIYIRSTSFRVGPEMRLMRF